MRPGVFGNTINMDGSRFIGLNVGYNDHKEHESSAVRLVDNINRSVDIKRGLVGLSREAKMDINKMDRWKNTMFRYNILHPKVELYQRDIEIRHNDKDLSTKILNDADYKMLLLGPKFTLNNYKNYLGQRRVFAESDIFNMEDYAIDLGIACHTELNKVRGSWGIDGMLILIEKSNMGKSTVVPTIEKSLKAGSLAIINNEPRLKVYKGCYLVCLDEAYKTMIGRLD